jgi:hypothetical protein
MVVVRYPRIARALVVVVCAVLAFSVASRPAHIGTLVITVLMAAVAVGVLAYRVEISRSGIRARYAPFYEKQIPLQDIQHVTEERQLVLVTRQGRVPIWNLPLRKREELFDILPGNLRVKPAQPLDTSDPRTSLRVHFRRTVILAGCFILAALLLIPFLDDYPLNRYWDTGGKYLLVLCMVLFALLSFEAVTTWVYWGYIRGVRRIEKPRHRRK